MQYEEKLVIVSGPTATGKSDAVLKLANAQDIIIINADSKQVYREIPIITAQPDCRYNNIHYLYGYTSIHSHYSVALWLKDAMSVIHWAWNNKKIPIIVGGTGMYIYSLLYGLVNDVHETNYVLRAKLERYLHNLGNIEFYHWLQKLGIKMGNLHHNDSYRLIRMAENFFSKRNIISDKNKPLFKNYLLYILMPERKKIYYNINNRFMAMLRQNIVQEVQSAITNKLEDSSLPFLKTCGFIEIVKYLYGDISLSLAVKLAQQSTRNYAKRQITWFRNQFQNATFVEDDKILIKKLSYI